MSEKINKKIITLVSIAILMTSTFILMINVPVYSQLAPEQPTSGPIPAGVTPDIIVPMTAYMSIRPTVVGLGQIFLVNLFPIPAPNANRMFKDFKITITKHLRTNLRFLALGMIMTTDKMTGAQIIPWIHMSQMEQHGLNG